MADLGAIAAVLETDQHPVPPRMRSMADAILARHEGRVQALVFYGSSLRDLDNPDKMLDFYVLVDSYRKTHGFRPRALLNWLIPPAVYYLENENDDGTVSRCKYSILALRAFERRCSARALLSQTWGRFCQPCIVISPRNDAIYSRIQTARANAVTHMAAQTRPLLSGPVTAAQFWARGFRESYRTELRPEASEGRSLEIVGRYAERYDALAELVLDVPEIDGTFDLPKRAAAWAKTKWFLRRLLGKPMTAIRVINSAATFDGGLDYVLHKVKSHSGVDLEVTEFQRRHPIICSPVLGWKLWRRGAFNK